MKEQLFSQIMLVSLPFLNFGSFSRSSSLQIASLVSTSEIIYTYTHNVYVCIYGCVTVCMSYYDKPWYNSTKWSIICFVASQPASQAQFESRRDLRVQQCPLRGAQQSIYPLLKGLHESHPNCPYLRWFRPTIIDMNIELQKVVLSIKSHIN